MLKEFKIVPWFSYYRPHFLCICKCFSACVSLLKPSNLSIYLILLSSFNSPEIPYVYVSVCQSINMSLTTKWSMSWIALFSFHYSVYALMSVCAGLCLFQPSNCLFESDQIYLSICLSLFVYVCLTAYLVRHHFIHSPPIMQIRRPLAIHMSTLSCLWFMPCKPL